MEFPTKGSGFSYGIPLPSKYLYVEVPQIYKAINSTPTSMVHCENKTQKTVCHILQAQKSKSVKIFDRLGDAITIKLEKMCYFT